MKKHLEAEHGAEIKEYVKKKSEELIAAQQEQQHQLIAAAQPRPPSSMVQQAPTVVSQPTLSTTTSLISQLPPSIVPSTSEESERRNFILVDQRVTESDQQIDIFSTQSSFLCELHRKFSDQPAKCSIKTVANGHFS
uniref:Uncharacterized protein n=1 Tax=Romanomermis culicivorax TaxID=13658 RepID=A0A915JGR1_ROMCU